MERSYGPELHPSLLPAGTVVGRWRVVAWAGRGVHGAVYRAVPLGQHYAPPVALKLALSPADPRFAREAQLLSRVRHPSVPRLWDSGSWLARTGMPYPFLAMDWVDGAPLYEQSLYPRCAPQVVGMLAQLARALQALHSLGAVHRDVKGDNILVRYGDGRALLTDFGSCHYPGTDTLTPPGTNPGTPAYRSPEAWGRELNRDRSGSPRAQAADDLFALGVTACRLVTGEYPEPATPEKDERGRWRMPSMQVPAALRTDERIQPRLRMWILRLLSERPEERGTAEQLAESLEQEVSPDQADTPAPRSRRVPGVTRQPETSAAAVPGPVVSTRSGRALLALAAVVLAVAMAAGWAGSRRTGDSPSLTRAGAAAENRSDVGTAGLGDAAAATSTEPPADVPEPKGMAEDTPPTPLPDQIQPDSKGRCPHKKQVVFNGGCWWETPLDRETCEAILNGYKGSMYKDKCYLPVLQHGRQPNSSPMPPP